MVILSPLLLLACFGPSEVPELQPNPAEKEIDDHRYCCVLHPAGKVDWIVRTIFVQSPFQNQIRT